MQRPLIVLSQERLLVLLRHQIVCSHQFMEALRYHLSCMSLIRYLLAVVVIVIVIVLVIII